LWRSGKSAATIERDGFNMTPAMAIDPVARILVVDDDIGLREQISAYLTAHDYAVLEAGDARELEAALAQESVDLIVLDVMLPGDGGLDVCRRLKARGGGPPIIMLSAMGEDVDRIVGLELGADDYLAKPCAPRELLARVRALLRRRQSAGAQAPSGAAGNGYRFRDFVLDIWRRQLQAPNGVVILLTSGEFRLLVAFLEKPNQILSREQLLDDSIGADAEVFDRAIDVQVSRLRRKLGACCDHEIIRTFRGAGYMLDAVVSQL
jgi:two-component system, OmpR family, response regulator